MQNKANVKIGKMNISIAIIKDYDKEQRTTNKERYSKQTQTKPIFKRDDGFSAFYTRDYHAVSIPGKPKTCKRSLCKCLTRGGKLARKSSF